MELMSQIETRLTNKHTKKPEEEQFLERVKNRVEVFVTLGNDTNICQADIEHPLTMLCYRMLYSEFVTKKQKVCNSLMS
jgi:hypothetical protein